MLHLRHPIIGNHLSNSTSIQSLISWNSLTAAFSTPALRSNSPPLVFPHSFKLGCVRQVWTGGRTPGPMSASCPAFQKTIYAPFDTHFNKHHYCRLWFDLAAVIGSLFETNTALHPSAHSAQHQQQQHHHSARRWVLFSLIGGWITAAKWERWSGRRVFRL